MASPCQTGMPLTSTPDAFLAIAQQFRTAAGGRQGLSGCAQGLSRCVQGLSRRVQGPPRPSLGARLVQLAGAAVSSAAAQAMRLAQLLRLQVDLCRLRTRPHQYRCLLALACAAADTSVVHKPRHSAAQPPQTRALNRSTQRRAEPEHGSAAGQRHGSAAGQRHGSVARQRHGRAGAWAGAQGGGAAGASPEGPQGRLRGAPALARAPE